MSISYVNRSSPRLTCDAARNQWGERQCQALGADQLERLVVSQVLLALEPASLELSLAAADQVESERKRIQQHHQQDVERASYECERARRAYSQVEPEHRLVARELERRWEAALTAKREAEEALEQFLRSNPARLTEAERERIRGLARDVPAIWHSGSTTRSDRQQIIRHMIEYLQVTVIDGTERVQVTIRWAGGWESRHEIHRRVSSYRGLAGGAEVLQRVGELKQLGLPHAEVARRLGAEGYHPPSGDCFTRAMVTFLCKRARQVGLMMPVSHCDDVARTSATALEPNWPDCWRASELAKRLKLPATTLNTWRRRGWINASRQVGRWLYWADGPELKRLLALRKHARAALIRVPSDLTTPIGQPCWPERLDENEPLDRNSCVSGEP